MSEHRHRWTIAEVADAVGPSANVRNYLEQRDLRRCLLAAAARLPIRRACDVGCGYGRLTMVLTESAAHVVGFEREASFVEEAARLLPTVEFQRIETLASLPAPDGAFDFAMTFTVLQHLGDAEARRVLAELQRVARGGIVLLTEETDPTLVDGVEGGDLTKGRSRETYREWMRPFVPVLEFARQIEPGYPRDDVGTYMMFADSSGHRGSRPSR
jgi:SAM-dependent methyltransferase